jgi:flagellar basal-body rod modification protein FlgD
MEISNQQQNVTTSLAAGTSGANSAGSAAGSHGNQRGHLTVNDFLKIMAAELKNQNPMGSDSGGGSKTDFITQLTQLNTLSQMTAMSEGISHLTMVGESALDQMMAMSKGITQFNMMSQTALIGKQVRIHGETHHLSGIVEKVKFYNSHVYLQVEGKDYPIENLLEVEEVKANDPSNQSSPYQQCGDHLSESTGDKEEGKSGVSEDPQ